MTDRTRGIFCILASAFGFALMAMFVRLCDDFGAPVSSMQKSFFRNVIALAIALTVFVRERKVRCGKGGTRSVASATEVGPSVWTRQATAVLFLRAALGTVGIFANFYALSHITIAEGQTLNKTAPFFTVLFAWLLLGERASRRQVTALVLAFAGVLFIAKPGFAGEDAFPLAMGLLGGMCAGGAYACVRKLGLLGVNGALIILFFSAFSCLASVPFMLHRFDPMTTGQVLSLLGAGVGAAIGQFGITAAYRFAAPRQIAVFDYSNILFTAALGFCFFGQVPDLWSVLGFVVIILAALRM